MKVWFALWSAAACLHSGSALNPDDSTKIAESAASQQASKPSLRAGAKHSTPGDISLTSLEDVLQDKTNDGEANTKPVATIPHDDDEDDDNWELTFADDQDDEQHRRLKSGELCDQTWWMVNKKTKKRAGIPYCTSKSLKQKNTKITRIVITQHGRKYNPMTFLDDMKQAASDADVEESTVIVAPQVIRYKYVQHFGLDPNDYLQWNKQWVFGSSVAQPFKKSVFHLYDDLLKLFDRVKGDIFPNLTHVVLVGHSAGGQFVQRYAMGSAYFPVNYKMRYIVMNPSTYGYLDRRRPVRRTRSVRFVCPKYDKWGYGLTKMHKFRKKIGGRRGVRDNYQKRDVVYILGSRDVKGVGGSLDSTCPAMLQGRNRFVRGKNYFKYLQKFYEKDVHRMDVVPGVGHKQAPMFQSEVSRPYIFFNGKFKVQTDDWWAEDKKDQDEDQNEMIEGEGDEDEDILSLSGPPRNYNASIAMDEIPTEDVPKVRN